ncbi:hypothetical protein [Aliarcobacter butzleri]|uniref:hypothetical protein n=1 Tax=Aliarcobacter butzleri TaxID=28197 RepID=UPI003AF5B9C0|nr:hypothetical protein [Aliarcobacter butzleri]
MKEYKNFKIIKEPKNTKNYLVTIAIGKKYYNSWEFAALPLWKEYCENNDIGIIVFHQNLVSKDYFAWKKATWQKLIIGTVLKENNIEVENICYVDTDILINPYAPNVFDGYDKNTIGVVSLRKNIPQPLNETLRREAFLRHTYYDNNYPLDSALFTSTEDLYKYHNLEPQDNFFCAGFFIFNLQNHTELMKKMFDKYPSNVESITGGGDQTHVNYEFLTYGHVSWFDYRFQAIWVYEMAWKYPFLYNYGKDNKELIKECIEASLYQNYFLHFAGSWHESDMWEIGGFFETKSEKEELKNYYEYLKQPVTGEPKGVLKPKKEQS